MKMVETKTPVYGSVTGEAKSFGMEFSSKAYTILSSGLYKYKIRAFIREISCNAKDGHKALFLKTGFAPHHFDIELPSHLNQQWRCRDYGIGLSPEGIDKLFTTYFASSKDESDDFIGAFGLGSKSPFCYTTTFTVTSWFNGVKTVYSIYMNNGEPTCVPVHSEPSDEPTGVEIVIPVDNEDIKEIIDESRFVYYTFDKDDYYPNFIGINPDVGNFKEKDSLKPKLYDSGTYAVMGGVSYAIPRKFIDGTLCEIKYPKNQTRFVEFEMGSLNPLPNREELSLDDHTISSIKKYFETHEASIWDDVNSCIEDKKDAREKINAINNLPYGSMIWKMVNNKINHNHQTLAKWDTFYYNTEHTPAIQDYIKYITANLKDRSIAHMRSFNNTSNRVFDRTRDYYRGNYKVTFSDNYLPHKNPVKYNTPICIVNMDNNKYKKNIRSLMAEGVIPNKSSGVLMFHDNKSDWNKKQNKMIRNVMVEIAKRYHKDDIEIYDVDKLWLTYGPEIEERRELERKKARKNSVRSKTTRIPGHTVIKYSPDGSAKELQLYAKDIDDLKGMFTITKSGYCWENDETKFSVEPYNDNFKLFSKLVGKEVYKIPSALIKRTTKNEDLKRISFEDFKTRIYNDTIARLTYDTVGFNVFSYRYKSDDVSLTDKIKTHLGVVSEQQWDKDVSRDYHNLRHILSYDECKELEQVIKQFEFNAAERYKDKIEEFKKQHLIAYTVMKKVDYSDEVAVELNKMVLGE